MFDHARLPVQWVVRPHDDAHHDYRGHAGQLAAGTLRVGDEVVVLPEGMKTRIAKLDTFDGEVDEAFAPMSVTALLEDDLDVSRGDMVCAADAPAEVARDLQADVCWLGEQPARASGRYLIKHTSRTTRAELTRIEHRVDVGSLRTEPDPGGLELNDIGRVTLRTAAPLVVDRYDDNRATGSFILIDETTNATVAAGMVVEPVRDGGARSPNVVWERGEATREDRWQALGQRGATIWLTGLPASGKSAIAAALEARLVGSGIGAYLIDGDNLRHGLSGDLGFDAGSRAENVRRAGEAARMMADAGLVVLVALVSPYAEHRDRVRRRHAEEDLPYVEVYVDTPLEVCEQRDPKGLYRRARAGTLHGMTGVDDPYEPPARPRPGARRHAPGQGGSGAARGAAAGARAAVISYLVCATPRSGSTLLCETLHEDRCRRQPRGVLRGRPGDRRAAPAARLPGRARRPGGARARRGRAAAPAAAVLDVRGVGDYEEHLARVREWGTTPNGVFGAKIMWAHLEDLAPAARERRQARAGRPGCSTARGWSWSGARTRSARPCRCGARCRRSRGARRTRPDPASRTTRSPPSTTSSSSSRRTTPPGSASWPARPSRCSRSRTRKSPPTRPPRCDARSSTSAATAAQLGALPRMRRQADERSDAWAERYARDALAVTG